MDPHAFTCGGAIYLVSFSRVDDQWIAALIRLGDRSLEWLAPLAKGELARFTSRQSVQRTSEMQNGPQNHNRLAYLKRALTSMVMVPGTRMLMRRRLDLFHSLN